MTSKLFRLLAVVVHVTVVCLILLSNMAYYCEAVESRSSSSKIENPLLLLISFDGFRWDYLKTHKLPNFEKLKSNSSYADFIYNSFATLTFPNHWTMVTGLYEESHGILHNNMYDPTLKKKFVATSRETQTIEWFSQNGKKIEPIWATNQKAGTNRRSAAEWVGSNMIFDNQTIIDVPFNATRPFNELVDQFVGFFNNPTGPINFGAIYFNEPDATGHVHGPYSEEMKNKLIELDHVLGYLIEKLQSSNLYDKLNLIVTSDHGMEATSLDRIVVLEQLVNISLVDVFGSATIRSLFLKNQSDLEPIYSTLKKVKNINVYKKGELPDELHYKNNVRHGDILLVADSGYMISVTKNETKYYPSGSHGYFNNISAMYPIFMAHGPAFKQNFQIESFKNVDMYELMCAVLDINPAPNNGTLDNVKAMLNEPRRDQHINNSLTFHNNENGTISSPPYEGNKMNKHLNRIDEFIEFTKFTPSEMKIIYRDFKLKFGMTSTPESSLSFGQFSELFSNIIKS